MRLERYAKSNRRGVSLKFFIFLKEAEEPFLLDIEFLMKKKGFEGSGQDDYIQFDLHFSDLAEFKTAYKKVKKTILLMIKFKQKPFLRNVK